MPQNLLEQLRTFTTVVADTGDMEAMEQFRPQDATTNPSLITAAAQLPQYQPIVDGVLRDARRELGGNAADALVANLCHPPGDYWDRIPISSARHHLLPPPLLPRHRPARSAAWC